MRISSSLTRMCCPVRRMRYTLPRRRLPILREKRFTLHDHCLKQLGIEARKGSITPAGTWVALLQLIITKYQKGKET